MTLQEGRLPDIDQELHSKTAFSQKLFEITVQDWPRRVMSYRVQIEFRGPPKNTRLALSQNQCCNDRLTPSTHIVVTCVGRPSNFLVKFFFFFETWTEQRTLHS